MLQFLHFILIVENTSFSLISLCLHYFKAKTCYQNVFFNIYIVLNEPGSRYVNKVDFDSFNAY